MSNIRSALATLSMGFAVSLLGSAGVAAQTESLITISEQSGFTITGRYAEVETLCAEFEKQYPGVVRCFQFGTTPEGRPMLALAASRTGALTAEEARAQNLPVVMVQGGIHAGEIDGKDAGFLVLREVLEGKAAAGSLDKQVLLFVPVFNVDGHERFKAYNRPNQRGPEEMGWRSTSQNYNLNRDYVKVDSAEMRAMLAMYNEWDPLISLDLHATNGAQFEVDVSIQVEPVYGGDEILRESGLAFREAVIEDLKTLGHDPKHFYIEFAETDHPESGFVHEMYNPRFSTGYFPLRNRINMLVETHSWKEYPVRVNIMRNTIVSTLEQVTAHGADWLVAAKEADKRSMELGGKPVALTYSTTDESRQIEFAGYEYTVSDSEISGSRMIEYHEDKPQVWTVPLRDTIVPGVTQVAPTGGYVVPASYSEMVKSKLEAHDIAYTVIGEASAAQDLEVFRAVTATPSTGSVEGHQTMKVAGEWATESVSLAPGSVFVPIAQPKAQLIVAMFEPVAPDSLLAWGFFNTAFESKEYMESYVTEQVAREMLAADPELAKTFADKLATDADFAASRRDRLRFFYKLHPSWDDRLNLYPVMRSGSVLK